jgi:hypothetical protein
MNNILRFPLELTRPPSQRKKHVNRGKATKLSKELQRSLKIHTLLEFAEILKANEVAASVAFPIEDICVTIIIQKL